MEKVAAARQSVEDVLPEELAICFRDAGDMSIDADHIDTALDYYNKAIKVYDQEYGENNTYSAIVYTFIYYVYLKLRCPEKQIEYLNKRIQGSPAQSTGEPVSAIYQSGGHWFQPVYS